MKRRVWFVLQAAAIAGGIWLGVAVFRAITG